MAATAAMNPPNMMSRVIGDLSSDRLIANHNGKSHIRRFPMWFLHPAEVMLHQINLTAGTVE
jgi:hypothetical protein